MSRTLANGELRLSERRLLKIKQRFPPARYLSLMYAAWGTAILCAVVASVMIAPGFSGVLGAGLGIVVILIAAIDARQFRIPDALVLAGLVLGLAEAATDGSRTLTAALMAASLRAATLMLVLLGFRVAYRLIRRREGLGLGDVKLGAVAGIWLGWTAAALAIDFAAVAALAMVLIDAFRGKPISATTRVPFGLFFAPAIWLVWLLSLTGLRLIA